MSETFLQIVLLVLGAVVGLALALLVQPLLQEKAEVLLVRVVSALWFRKSESLSGSWMFVWTKEGSVLDRSEEIPVQLSCVGKRIAGRFAWRGRSYWVLGRRETDEFISGTYLDEKAGLTFHGAFQLRILPDEQTMAGRWIGFNTNHEIIQGPWHWRQKEANLYPFEVK